MAALYPPRKSYIQKRIQFFGRQFARFPHARTFDKASKCLQIALPQPKIEIRSTKSKDSLFAQYYNDIIEHPNRQIRSSLRFGNNNSCVFSIKKFELHGKEVILTEIVHLNHREIHHLCKNRFCVANKFEIFERTYDV